MVYGLQAIYEDVSIPPESPIDYEKFGQLVAQLVAGLSAAIKVQLTSLNLNLDDINARQQDLFIGYVWGLCDVMAQHAGFKSSSEVSRGIFAGVLKFLQQTDPEQALELLMSQAGRQSDDFIQGLRAGGEDAAGLREDKSDMSGFSSCFT